MRQRQFIFQKRFGHFHLICSLATELYQIEAVKAGDYMNMLIHIQENDQSNGANKPKTSHLLIEGSRYFQLLDEEEKPIDSHTLEIDLKKVFRGERQKAIIPLSVLKVLKGSRKEPFYVSPDRLLRMSMRKPMITPPFR